MDITSTTHELTKPISPISNMPGAIPQVLAQTESFVHSHCNKCAHGVHTFLHGREATYCRALFLWAQTTDGETVVTDCAGFEKKRKR